MYRRGPDRLINSHRHCCHRQQEQELVSQALGAPEWVDVTLTAEPQRFCGVPVGAGGGGASGAGGSDGGVEPPMLSDDGAVGLQRAHQGS